MKRNAIEKARNRLERAREAFGRIEASRDFQSFEPAWTDFLTATNSIYSILEQSSKGDVRDRQWFGGKKRERREDPLLQYVHQARNADEHGAEPVSAYEPGGFFIGKRGESVHIKRMVTGPSGVQEISLEPVDGALPTIGLIVPRVKLVPVRDERYGDTFNPPTEHLGRPLDDTSAKGVAALALRFHEALVDEAESRVT
jgi:hypothetical protein